jgi:AcrR family transcriptional regulator
MGRLKHFEPERVLNIAMWHFWSQGYHAAKLDDIAQAASVSKPSLYAAFGDKDTLYQLVLERYYHLFCERILNAMDKAGSMEEVIRFFLHEMLAIFLDGQLPGGCFRVQATLECLDSKPDLFDVTTNLRAMMIKAMQDIFLAKGAPKALATRLSSMLIVLYDGLAVAARSGENEEILRETASLSAAGMLSLVRTALARSA